MAAAVVCTTLVSAQPAEALTLKGYQNARTYPYAGKCNGEYDIRGMKKCSCVSYGKWRVAKTNRVIMRNLGTAKDWKRNAIKAGYKVNKTPAKGAIAWWERGHVAWMDYDPKNGWEIHEYNWNYRHKKEVRLLKYQRNGARPDAYIHIKDLPR